MSILTSSEQSVPIPISGITALGAVCAAKVCEGQQVLIYGASGSVGQYAIKISKKIGATVTAVCSNRSREIVRGTGADFIIDYEWEDFIRLGKHFDTIIAVRGYNQMDVCKKLLKNSGIYVAIGGAKLGIKGGIPGSNIFIDDNKKMTCFTYFSALKKPYLPCLKTAWTKVTLTHSLIINFLDGI
jgi:NADPH:quinone reductase-like Zn-dependent oxidoreductase